MFAHISRHLALTIAAGALGAALSLLPDSGALAQSQQQAPGGGAGNAQPTQKEDFGDWTKLCNATPNGGEECFIYQNVTAQETGKSVLHMTIVRIPEEQQPILIVTVPLGVFLPAGLEMNIDGKEAGRLQVQVCSTNGCQSQSQFDNQLLQMFKGGLNGTMTLVDPNGQEVNVPFSLKGFTAALGSLG